VAAPAGHTTSTLTERHHVFLPSWQDACFGCPRTRACTSRVRASAMLILLNVWRYCYDTVHTKFCEVVRHVLGSKWMVMWQGVSRGEASLSPEGKRPIRRPRCRRGAVIKMDINKQVQRAWKGFISLKIGTIVGLL
jgi:hypothetical protein